MHIYPSMFKSQFHSTLYSYPVRLVQSIYPAYQPHQPYTHLSYHPIQMSRQDFSPHVTFYNFTRQQYPPVDPDQFIASAAHFPILLDDARRILNRIQSSRTFAVQLKEAAQRSERDKVEELIHSIGLQTRASSTFTPDQLKIDLRLTPNEIDCCHLSLSLRW